MSKTILTNFSNNAALNKPITSEQIEYLEQYCVYFETKNEHPLALNSALLGVYPIYFLDLEKNMLFDILEVNEEDMKEAIRQTPFINPEFKVRSDAYNNLVIWTAHKILISETLTNDEKEKGLFNIFKMLIYKFFTSTVNHSYKHGANKAIMEATISSLSNKYYIVQYGTWKKLIEARSKDIYDPSSIHYKYLLNYDNDEKVLYILSDTQSRIRTQIRLISEAYYAKYEEGDKIDTYSSIGVDKEGNKTIVTNTNTYDLMIAGLLAQIQSPARFIDNELIHILCIKDKSSFVKEDAFRRVLTTFTQLASLQSANNELELEGTTEDGRDIYLGCNILIREFIQKTYRYCTLSGINMSDANAIIKKTKDIYTSSRISDPDILKIKNSFAAFVIGCGESRRPATNATITSLMILYILIRTFKYL